MLRGVLEPWSITMPIYGVDKDPIKNTIDLLPWTHLKLLNKVVVLVNHTVKQCQQSYVVVITKIFSVILGVATSKV